MADLMLAPLTPLGHALPEQRNIGPVTLTEVIDSALGSLTARAGRLAELAERAAAAGLPLPAPGQSAEAAPYGAFWLAPESWMVEAPFASHEDIRAHLVAIFGDAASITEQTDAWVRFDVTGADLPRLFERLSNVDLARAPDHAATRTVIDHIGCYLVKRGPTRISLFGPRSSAPSLWHALETAARAAF
ncbi:sarcosine oxidase subunit gamma [Gemmobacter aquatilis]|uniref:Sarcosine oxidase subunit gamma n=1 Tax=Gemmobacter aquatilis TaxID=933059 RepID=A0A1H8FGS7_9RHOB|nr:sarcosine oxidase subunit gamma [Gemmobacter aquatilis]SEN30832.1 sarcosine oxidase subunit gamma [Gemmobacter aquatilis]